MRLRRDNHYLPECYQRGFANDEGQVWVKFANEVAPLARNPRSLGRKRNLYVRKHNGKEDDEIEILFDKGVENEFALLSQRLKSERETFSTMSGTEVGTLLKFVATQAVRTLAHMRLMQAQTGGFADSAAFQQVMLRQTHAIMQAWREHNPFCQFHTPLPFVGSHFITGDHPVVVTETVDSQLWAPSFAPKAHVSQLKDILGNEKFQFWLTLTPYICVSIYNAEKSSDRVGGPKTLDAPYLRQLNAVIRDQCKYFILARDKESL